MAKRTSEESLQYNSTSPSSATTTIRLTNGKIKGYHVFRIKCVVGMEVEVKRETSGVDELALMCYVPQNLPDGIAAAKVMSKSSGRSYTMNEMAGRPMGRVQYFLNKAFIDLIEGGKAIKIKGLVTGNPTTTKAPPPTQKWVKNKREGGGGFTPCQWIVEVHSSSLESALAIIHARLKDVEEGATMKVEVDETAKKWKLHE